jgi:chorismate dehydratase
VSYLNTVPLVWGMLHGPQRGRFDLSFRLPAECAERLATGEADLGLVPAIEVLRQGLEIAAPVGIASNGPVRSILLVSKVPPDRIRTLAGDTSSRTSVQLSRILLGHRYGAEPKILSMRPDLTSMLGAADAALIIGDPALHLEPSALPFHVLDLGEEWMRWTGLPMVYAVWAGRAEHVRADHAAIFSGSYEYGRERLDEIVQSESPRRGLDRALVRRYLTEHIVFALGAQERQGLELFLEQAGALRPLAFPEVVSL